MDSLPTALKVPEKKGAISQFIDKVNAFILSVIGLVFRFLNWLFNSILTFLLFVTGLTFALGSFGLFASISTTPEAVSRANLLIGLTVLASMTFARLVFAYKSSDESASDIEIKMKKVGGLFTVASVNLALFFLLLVPFALGLLPLKQFNDPFYWITLIYFSITVY